MMRGVWSKVWRGTGSLCDDANARQVLDRRDERIDEKVRIQTGEDEVRKIYVFGLGQL